MSHHAYSRCWIHLVWATLNRERLLPPRAAAETSQFLSRYAREKGIALEINFVNADHIHALIDLSPEQKISEVVQLLKGASSHWINGSDLIHGKFSWGRGYGAFSVSQSDFARVKTYIKEQEKHHRTKTFAEEYQRLVEVYGLVWQDDGKVADTGKRPAPPSREKGNR